MNKKPSLQELLIQEDYPDLARYFALKETNLSQNKEA
jgi:hypothetical protein